LSGLPVVEAARPDDQHGDTGRPDMARKDRTDEAAAYREAADKAETEGKPGTAEMFYGLAGDSERKADQAERRKR
jgi:hypothetical protein